MADKLMEGTNLSEGALSDTGQERSVEDKERLTRVLCGSLDKLPALSSKIVRIFTSSTFTGKLFERFLNICPKYFYESMCLIVE